MAKKGVLVGMSGGVDSSFAAALLKQQGYDVIGLMLQLWTEPTQEGENRCCSLDSQHIARRVAAQLDIPFYVVDAKEDFRSLVVDDFLHQYSIGKTPNPCVLCNSQLRWRLLRKKAADFGLDFIATGHYAIIETNGLDHFALRKGIDNSKDQSYALAMVPDIDLMETILPLGKMTKAEVRKESLAMHLPSAAKPDSQDLCFLGNLDYRDFIAKYAGNSIVKGEIVNTDGKIVGNHNGLPFYTIGQRKGLRIANKLPYYVIDKNFDLNQLIVSTVPDKGKKAFFVERINWLKKIQEGSIFDCQVQVRYRSEDIPVQVTPIDASSASVTIKGSLRSSITPSQVAVFYQADRCLGGGIIV